MKLGAITLQNSVCLATAPWELDGVGYEQLGAIFTKTVTMEPRPGLPTPEPPGVVWVETPDGIRLPLHPRPRSGALSPRRGGMYIY